jgi:hypothetical protein
VSLPHRSRLWLVKTSKYLMSQPIPHLQTIFIFSLKLWLLITIISCNVRRYYFIVSIYTRFFYTQIQYLSETSSKSAPSNGCKRFKVDDDNLAFELDRGCLDKRKYSLKSGWKLHMYISQLPCNLIHHFHPRFLL